jgi:branched-chain amino acid transport system ATP-binding protein
MTTVQVAESPPALLDVVGLAVRRGPTPVIRDVDLSIAGGEVVAILGPNGAGKSTLLLCIAGIVPAERGRITVGGRRIDRTDAVQRAQLGIVHLPQGRRLFASLSARHNIELAARFAGRRRVRSARAATATWLDRLPGLRSVAERRAGLLSGGQQQQVTVARGLVTGPRVVLADEPLAGLAGAPRLAVLRELRRLADIGAAVAVVEQNVDAALSIADRSIVLVAGRITERRRVR